MSDDKRLLRSEMRQIRIAIPDRGRRSLELCDRVAARIDQFAQSRSAGRGAPLVVLSFVGVGSEPDTGALQDWLHARGHVVALPRVTGDHFVAGRHEPDGELLAGEFGIPAPMGEVVDPQTIDVVVVPGLAFTRDGRRLGQGGGYYDRFLPTVRVDCLTIGACFSEQIVEHLPTDPHDRNLAVVVTDAVSE